MAKAHSASSSRRLEVDEPVDRSRAQSAVPASNRERALLRRLGNGSVIDRLGLSPEGG
jgi:hypothetical protein